MATMEMVDQETELKQALIQKIASTHHLGVLQGLLLILDDVAEDVYVLTPEEEKMIDEAEAELDAGLGIPAEDFHKETQAWLKSLKVS